jgi:formylglycine-generating enzyme required for sulfatase activity
VNLADVDQTEVHDRFRLGVVIYYLLFGGPPFRGLWQGGGDSLEQSELIRRGLWPFSGDKLLVPSNTTIPLNILHPDLHALFLRCFNEGHKFPHRRPTAKEWCDTLEAARKEVIRCGKIDTHYYSRRYGKCYWCERFSDLNLDIFASKSIATVTSTPSPKVAPPPLSSPPPPPISIKSSPSPIPPQRWSRRKVLITFGLFTVGTVASNIFAQLFRQNPTPPPSPSPRPLAPPFTENLPKGITLEMVNLPAGQFLMGSPDSDPDARDNEKPQHQVKVNSFAIGKYPVTQAQYEAVMGTNPSRFQNNPQNPVEKVSWNDAQAFCQKLSQITGKTYRLPTEAEWEYACRAGTTTRFYFGDDANQLGDYAWYYGNSQGTTHPVGQKKPNAWGLYDMSGNVWEWCEDNWHDNYIGAPTDGSAWLKNGNDNRSPLRGGSWFINPYYCRSAFRDYYDRRDFSVSIGFRVVCGAGRTL